jgi:hypothetical protein
MSRSLALSVVASVVLDGSGNGTVQVGPRGTNEVWQPQSAAVSAATNTSEAQCRIYAGNTISAGSLVDGTTFGSSGDSTTNFASQVWLGQSIWAQWTGGDPGATATLVVTGTRQVP